MAIAFMVAAAAAMAAPHPKLAPASGSKLVAAVQACQQIKDDAARLACYDRSVSALTAADARGDVAVVDREQMRETRRSLFGFSVPKLPFFSNSKDKDVQQEPKEVVSTILSFRGLGNGYVRFTIADAGIDLEIDRTDRRLRRKKRGKGEDRAWRDRKLLDRDREQPRVPRASRALGSKPCLLGLEAGLGVDIGLLPLDAPVAKLVQRNARAGDRADDMIAVGSAAGRCPGR